MRRNEKGRFAPKCELSVYDATLQVYDTMPAIFHGIIFMEKVRFLLGRPMCMDGTIFRRLRELKKDGKLNYRVKDSELSIYEKL